MESKKVKNGTDTSRSTDTSLTPATDNSRTSAGSRSLDKSKPGSKISLRRGSIPEEFYKAKAYLMKNSTISNINLFDHLTEVLGKIIEGRPANVVDYFEQISLLIKKHMLQYKDDAIADKENSASKLLRAQQEKKLFQVPTEGEGEEEEEVPDVQEEDRILPNLVEEMFYFEQGGIVLSRNEIVRITLAMKLLVRSYPLEKIRFWGKIIGIEKNYYIVETVYKEGEEIIEEEEEEEEVEGEESPEDDDILFKMNEDEGEEEEEESLVILKPKFKPPVVIPPEPFRSGLNKNVYFVCNEPGLPWIRLPHVLPSQIVVARQIFKYFTGRLDAPVHTNPAYPGKEINYLRAQIARISSASLISPAGFYRFAEEEEEGAKVNFIENEEFEVKPVSDLVDPSLENWVHYAPYILPQGRCTWVNPKQLKTDEKEEEEAEEEEGEEESPEEPEVGPPLLSPLSEDIVGEETQIWQARFSSFMRHPHSIAMVDSNIWPGAHAYAINKKFNNIYIGYGLKLIATVHNPPLPTVVMSEYPEGPEMLEMIDPTPAEEFAFLEAQKKEEESEDIEEDEEEEQ